MKVKRRIIKYEGSFLDVEFYYTPADPGVHTYPNGDPGHPPTPAKIEAHKIYFTGKDYIGRNTSINIISALSGEEVERIESVLIKLMEDELS